MEHSGMNVVDLGVIAVLLISGLLALWRGLVREMLSLGSWAGAGIVTVYFYPALRPIMHHHFKSEFTADAVTGLSLFCGSLTVFLILGYFLGSLVQGRALTAVDRSLGFVFGLARGALIVCLLFLVTLWVWPEEKKEPELLAQAKTRPLMLAGATMMKNFLPKEDQDKLAAGAHAIEKKVDGIGIDQLPAAAATTSSGRQDSERQDSGRQDSGRQDSSLPPQAKPDVIERLLGSSSDKDTNAPADQGNP